MVSDLRLHQSGSLEGAFFTMGVFPPQGTKVCPSLQASRNAPPNSPSLELQGTNENKVRWQSAGLGQEPRGFPPVGHSWDSGLGVLGRGP